MTEIVPSVSVSEPGMAMTNRAFDTGTKIFTLKSFLSANATRATNFRHGIDYCSSNNSTTCAMQSISVPIMIAAMGAYQCESFWRQNPREEYVENERACSRRSTRGYRSVRSTRYIYCQPLETGGTAIGVRLAIARSDWTSRSGRFG